MRAKLVPKILNYFFAFATKTSLWQVLECTVIQFSFIYFLYCLKMWTDTTELKISKKTSSKWQRIKPYIFFPILSFIYFLFKINIHIILTKWVFQYPEWRTYKLYPIRQTICCYSLVCLRKQFTIAACFIFNTEHVIAHSKWYI